MEAFFALSASLVFVTTPVLHVGVGEQPEAILFRDAVRDAQGSRQPASCSYQSADSRGQRRRTVQQEPSHIHAPHTVPQGISSTRDSSGRPARASATISPFAVRKDTPDAAPERDSLGR